jgi:hypothetical protein
MLAVAAILFAAVFLLRLGVENPSQVVTLLYALPIALVAVELGMAWGLAAGALGLGLFGLWELAWAVKADHDAIDYLARGRSDELLTVEPPAYLCALPRRGSRHRRDGQVPAARPRRRLRLAPGVRRGGAGWWCYGCCRGGRIYDRASLLAGGPWGRELRAEAFVAGVELARAALGGNGTRR